MHTKHVVLVEDHKIVIEGLKACMAPQKDIEYKLTPFSSSTDAWHYIQCNQPDLVITDLDMPKLDGIELCKKIKECWPRCKVIAFTSFENIEIMEQCQKAAFDGFVLKSQGLDTLFDAVKTVIEGKTYYPQHTALNVTKKQATFEKRSFNLALLSVREIEILKLMCAGLDNKTIGEKLFISTNTVKTHRKHIFKKTGANNIAELIAFAYRHGMTDLNI